MSHRHRRRHADERRAGASTSLGDRILAGIAAVRADPLLAVWFEPENMAVPIAVSQSSELLRDMSSGLVDQLDAPSYRRAEIERRGEWLLRCIVSLLAMPASDAEAERAMIESFLVPVLTAEFRTWRCTDRHDRQDRARRLRSREALASCCGCLARDGGDQRRATVTGRLV